MNFGNTIASLNKGAVYMKKMSIFLTLTFLSILVVGCNGTGDNTKNVNENATVSESGANDKTEADQSEYVKDNTNTTTFSFSEFDLEVDYKDNQSYEVDYENDKNGTQASVENDLKNQKLVGNEAYAELEPLLKKLTFTSKSTDEEVKKEILSVFNIKEGYQKIDLDVKFTDGVVKEYTFQP